MSPPNDPMAEIRATFFGECEELLEALLDGLQTMDNGEADDETINVVFRAVHSIKGGAGAFGLDNLVAFTHRFESVLDAVRSHKLTPEQNVIQTFFQASDILNDLVRAAHDGAQIDPTRTLPTITALDALIDENPEEKEQVTDFTPMILSLDFPSLEIESPQPTQTNGAAGLAPSESIPGITEIPVPELAAEASDEDTDSLAPVGFKIRFAPKDGLFASGNEPLHLLRILDQTGVMTVHCDTTALPSLRGLKAEAAYLAWDIALETDEPEAVLHEIFDFVEDVCDLTISPLEASDIVDIRPQPSPTDKHCPDSEQQQNALSLAPQPLDQAPPAVATDGVETTLATTGPREKTGKVQAHPQKAKPTVRVDLERIDRLVNLVGELVINQAVISQSIEKIGISSNPEIAGGLDEFMQLTRDIQDSVMMIRAQPVKSLFQRMARIVRETSAAIGKTARLRTEGETTEVDKTVIEHLADPLTHMIRNAIDHGLETPEQRRAQGKPPEGIVTLAASHRSGRVIIEISDDGAGINLERVRQIAMERGLIPDGADLTNSEIENLLFLPGFSTVTEVSNLSGRGVGMDVVRSSIQSLGGRVAIQSEPGIGTKFTISLPLTLAVLDGMVVEVAKQTLVVPLNTITETLMLTTENIRSLGPQSNVLQIRENFVPLLDLGAELGYRAPLESYAGSIVLMIAHEDNSSAALVVDEIQDQRQVVIKGLQDTFGRIPGVAAATILGDGKIALILDPTDVVVNAHERKKKSSPDLSLAG